MQEAIQLETAEQTDMAEWQAEMNARMLKSRKEHERRQRLHLHAQQERAGSASTPDQSLPKKRRMSLSTHLGAAFRKRGPRAQPKGTSSIPEADETRPTADHVQQHATATPHVAMVGAAPSDARRLPDQQINGLQSQGVDSSRYVVRREGREVILQVSPTGVTVEDADSTFYHLTTILSWRVRRSESSQPVGFKLVFTNGLELIFTTEQGREISDVMMHAAKGLASSMHTGNPAGMHVRGTVMVN